MTKDVKIEKFNVIEFQSAAKMCARGDDDDEVL